MFFASWSFFKIPDVYSVFMSCFFVLGLTVGGTGGELCNFPHSYINLDHFAGRERRENTLETRDKSLRKKTEIKS